MTASLPTYPVVMVIDIGTHESGIGFLLRRDYFENPKKVNRFEWLDDHHRPNETIPTCALFTKEKKFKAFGFEAESQYKEHVQENTHNDVYYFRHIIMDLFKNEVNNEFLIKDQSGKEMRSIEVLTACIKYFRDVATVKARMHMSKLTSTDIRWVIPVPIYWNNNYATFKKAAENAKIENLLIVTDTEAAFRYCKAMRGFIPPQNRTCLLLNAGRHSASLTVHKIHQEGPFLQCYQDTAENVGSSNIDTAFRNILACLFGDDVMNWLEAECEDDIDDMYRSFNIKTRRYSKELLKILIKIPSSLSNKVQEAYGVDMKEFITKKPQYDDDISVIRRQFLDIKSNLVKRLFDCTCNKIVSFLKQVCEKSQLNDIALIVMVGEFSTFPILQEHIQEAFRDKQILIADNADLAILIGAAICGHQKLHVKSKRFSEK